MTSKTRILILNLSLITIFPGVVFAADPVEGEGLVRIGQDSATTPVPKTGYNLQLEDIVLFSRGDFPTSLEAWDFGRVTDGVLTDFQFQIRDPLGILHAQFSKKGNRIFMGFAGSGLPPVLFATIGASDSGDESTGRSGENFHWKLKIEIPGIEVVAEGNRKYNPYSLLLPKQIEALAYQLPNASDVQIREPIHLNSKAFADLGSEALHSVVVLHDRGSDPNPEFPTFAEMRPGQIEKKEFWTQDAKLSGTYSIQGPFVLFTPDRDSDADLSPILIGMLSEMPSRIWMDIGYEFKTIDFKPSIFLARGTDTHVLASSQSLADLRKSTSQNLKQILAIYDEAKKNSGITPRALHIDKENWKNSNPWYRRIFARFGFEKVTLSVAREHFEGIYIEGYTNRTRISLGDQGFNYAMLDWNLQITADGKLRLSAKTGSFLNRRTIVSEAFQPNDPTITLVVKRKFPLLPISASSRAQFCVTQLGAAARASSR